MKDNCFRARVVAVVIAMLAILGALRATAADGPNHVAGKEFLAKAKVALKAVQEKAKDDKILGPITKAKFDQGNDPNGDGYLLIRTDTPESWPNFPSKPQNLARGYGWLRIDLFANQPEKPMSTPFIPPPGCYWRTTYLVVPNTTARILVETTTSDPQAQRRLVTLILKELNAAGINARPEDPEKDDSASHPDPR